jgi:tetrapyrrole methylase family protein/MazG family protein
MNINRAQEWFGRLLSIIVKLRSPEGCPWDREQSPLTLRKTLTEESYELIHAIEQDDTEGMREELGDVALNVAMIGQMLEEEGRFELADALQAICEKLIRRHPHVFGEAKVHDAQDVVRQWEIIKAQEKKGQPQSLLHKAGRGLPPLEKAQEVQKQAAKIGFDWTNPDDVINKILEELNEVRRERLSGNHEKLEMEVGDLLFSVVNLARHLGVEANLALNRSIEKFKQRFSYIEQVFHQEQRVLDHSENARMEELWEEAKKKG